MGKHTNSRFLRFFVRSVPLFRSLMLTAMQTSSSSTAYFPIRGAVVADQSSPSSPVFRLKYVPSSLSQVAIYVVHPHPLCPTFPYPPAHPSPSLLCPHYTSPLPQISVLTISHRLVYSDIIHCSSVYVGVFYQSHRYIYRIIDRKLDHYNIITITIKSTYQYYKHLF